MREISSPLDGFASPFGRRADLLNATAIARLFFSNDEPGVFYDFDDWSTLFQDTAGTQPVTAANQGVALALDKRLGLELGPELVTLNFIGASTSPIPNADGWRLNSVGGITILSSNSFSKISQATGMVYAQLIAGRFYEIDVDVSLSTADTFQIRNGDVGASPLVADLGISTSFSEKVRFLAGTNSVYFRFSDAATTVTFNSISVRELKGNHATQATTAARPLTVIHPDGGVRNLLDRTEEFSTATSTSLSPASEQTLTRAQSKRLRNTSAPSRQRFPRYDYTHNSLP
jgi:hypothetical protein